MKTINFDETLLTLDVVTPVEKAVAAFRAQTGYPDSITVQVGDSVWGHAMATNGHEPAVVEGRLSGVFFELDDELPKWTVRISALVDGDEREGTFSF